MIRRGPMIGGSLLVVAVVVVLMQASSLSVEEAVVLVRGAGALGILVFLATFVFLQPLGLSSHLLLLSAAVVWPPAMAFGLGLLGAVGAAVWAFLVARYIAYDAVQARLPDRIRAYETRMVEGGFKAIFLVRLVTFTMHPMMYLMGTARIRFWPMLFATILGYIPAVALDIAVGRGLYDLLFG